MYLCNMTREETLLTGFFNEVKKLKSEFPNDMELGKKLRTLIDDTQEKINHLNGETKHKHV